MGGGRQEFLPTWEQDCEGHSGKRTDGIDLIKRWQHKHQKHNAAYVQTKDELLNVIKTDFSFCILQIYLIYLRVISNLLRTFRTSLINSFHSFFKTYIESR